MKTQKIVLALALAAVTPAVLAAQENGNAYNKGTNEVIATNNQQTSTLYVGPGSKIGYIADNALTRIRSQHQSETQSEPNEQSNARKQQRNAGTQTQNNDTLPEAKPSNNTTQRPTSSYNPYGGPDGHAYLAGENLSSRLSARRQQRKAEKQTQKNDTVTTKSNTTPVQNLTRATDSLVRDGQLTINNKQLEKNARETHSAIYECLSKIGHAIAQEAPYMK